MSILDRLLPEPSFVVRDPEQVVRDLVARFELLTGRTLYPAQVERILVDMMAYRESLVREAIQDAGKLSLVRYSRAPILDYLGENIGVARLPAARATATVSFNTLAPAPAQVLIPAGTLVSAGQVDFELIEATAFPAGATSVAALVRCMQTGTVGNGFIAGQINTLVTPVAGLAISTVTNTDTSAGGSEEESDDNYRERIVLAPEQFSTAGSVGAYRFHARSAHPSIVDVAVLSPQPGSVRLYPLTSSGLPSAGIKADVLAKCSAERVRPLCDSVSVADPVEQTFSIDAALTLYQGTDATVALQKANEAAQAYVADLQKQLGRDVVRLHIQDALRVYGVYDVALTQPANTMVLTPEQWPRCTGITITVSGTAQG